MLPAAVYMKAGEGGGGGGRGVAQEIDTNHACKFQLANPTPIPFLESSITITKSTPDPTKVVLHEYKPRH